MKPFIYALYDPRTPEQVRYVGMTMGDSARPYQHGVDASRGYGRHVHCWIRNLWDEGEDYEPRTVEEFPEGTPHSVVYEAEKRHIKCFEDAGHRLTNLSDGGEGNAGWHIRLPLAERLARSERFSIAQKARRAAETPEAREKRERWRDRLTPAERTQARLRISASATAQRAAESSEDRAARVEKWRATWALRRSPKEKRDQAG